MKIAFWLRQAIFTPMYAMQVNQMLGGRFARENKKTMNKINIDNYIIHKEEYYSILYSTHEKKDYITALSNCLNKTYNEFIEYFTLPDGLDLTFIVFYSVDDCFLITKRMLNSSMFMLLEVNSNKANISLFSEKANAINSNMNRTKRHILHELMHLWITYETGSIRLMHDKNEGLNIPVWLDEGLSEYVSLTLTEEDDKLSVCMNEYKKASALHIEYDFWSSNSSYYYCIATGKTLDLLSNERIINLVKIKYLLKSNSIT